MADGTNSRRSPLLAGLFALAGATLMLCLGRTTGLLIVGRLLQGVSAGMVWSVGLALLVDTVGQRHIGQIMGYVAISLSCAMLAGPLLGGVVYERASYYAVFAMAFGLLALDIFFRVVMIEKKIAARWQSPEDDADAHSAQSSSVRASLEQASSRDRPVIGRPDHSDEKDSQRPQSEEAPNASAQQGESRPKEVFSRLPPVLSLLKSRRLLSALWCVFVQSLIIASFESVGCHLIRYMVGSI